MKHDTGFLLLAAWCLLLLQLLVCEIAEEVKPEIKFQSQAIVVLPWRALKDQLPSSSLNHVLDFLFQLPPVSYGIAAHC